MNEERITDGKGRIRGTPAASVGLVYAPHADTAVERAIEQFRISNVETQHRLVAVRSS